MKTIPGGQCFPFAFDEVVERGGVLVHGRVTHPWDKNKYLHAWIEKDGKVLDWQRNQGYRPYGQDVWADKEWWYGAWKPEEIVRYGQEEVRHMGMLKHRPMKLNRADKKRIKEYEGDIKRGTFAKKLDKLLYHGTSEEDAMRIYMHGGFKNYVYVVDDPKVAEHYAQARTVNVLKYLPKGKGLLSKFHDEPKYAVFEFKSIPDKAELADDNYSPDEKGQYIIKAPIIRSVHYRRKGGMHYKTTPLTKDKDKRLMLECFGIGMLQGDRPKKKKRR
jgi:hypothetical protein